MELDSCFKTPLCHFITIRESTDINKYRYNYHQIIEIEFARNNAAVVKAIRQVIKLEMPGDNRIVPCEIAQKEYDLKIGRCPDSAKLEDLKLPGKIKFILMGIARNNIILTMGNCPDIYEFKILQLPGNR